MTTGKTPIPAELDDLARRYRQESGVVRARAAAGWLLAGGSDALDAALDRELRAFVRDALTDLPEAIDELIDRATRAFLTADPDRHQDVAIDAWDLLCLRDLAEDLRVAGHPLVDEVLKAKLDAFDERLDDLDPWLDEEFDDARAAEAAKSGHGERRWWRSTFAEPSLELEGLELPPWPTELNPILWKPTPAEIDAWRRGELGGPLARLVERYATTGRVRPDLPSPNVIPLPRRPVGESTSMTGAGLLAASGDGGLLAPPPRPETDVTLRLDDDGEVTLGISSPSTLIVTVRLWHGLPFEVDLRGADGLPLVPTPGAQARAWSEELRCDRLEGARLIVRWGDELREVTFNTGDANRGAVRGLDD